MIAHLYIKDEYPKIYTSGKTFLVKYLVFEMMGFIISFHMTLYFL